jgi:hypothetical protein
MNEQARNLALYPAPSPLLLAMLPQPLVAKGQKYFPQATYARVSFCCCPDMEE